MINLGGRKFFATVMITAIGLGLVAWKGDIPSNFLTLLGWVFSVFVAGNVASDFAAIKAQTPAEPVTVDLSGLTGGMEQLKSAAAIQQTSLTALVEFAARVEEQSKALQAQIPTQANKNRQALSGFTPT